MIVFDDIYKEFDSGEIKLHALRGINLKIPKGAIFGIIGRSGAGKSTLIRTINMLERPTSGRVLVNGVDMTTLNGEPLRDARKGIGMIFQSFNLLSSRTVAQNVAFPLELSGCTKNELEHRVSELLNLVGLEGKINDYPSQLSGGQKQRVGIARALAGNPQILLCDEATSALDPQTTDEVLELLSEINKKLGLTIVLITHEMSVIKQICTDVAVLDKGELVETGAVFKVFTVPESGVTRELVASVMTRKLPQHFTDIVFLSAHEENSALLLRISFLGDTAADPIISGMIRKCGVDANILYGTIDHIQGVPYGTLVIELLGAESDCNGAIEYLGKLNLGVEVMGYVKRNFCIAV